MGCSSSSIEGALWDVNDWNAEGSVVRAGEVWICANSVNVGATEPKTKKQRTTNDRSGGSHVLVEEIVLISTVGVAIVREGTASMRADGIDVRLTAIYRRWDLSMFVCSEYLFLPEIGGYENN